MKAPTSVIRISSCDFRRSGIISITVKLLPFAISSVAQRFPVLFQLLVNRIAPLGEGSVCEVLGIFLEVNEDVDRAAADEDDAGSHARQADLRPCADWVENEGRATRRGQSPQPGTGGDDKGHHKRLGSSRNIAQLDPRKVNYMVPTIDCVDAQRNER